MLCTHRVVGSEAAHGITVEHVVLHDAVVDADVLEAPVHAVDIQGGVGVHRALYREVGRPWERR